MLLLRSVQQKMLVLIAKVKVPWLCRHLLGVQTPKQKVSPESEDSSLLFDILPGSGGGRPISHYGMFVSVRGCGKRHL